MGHRQHWSEGIEFLGGYAYDDGPIVLGPASLRKQWHKAVSARDLKALTTKERVAVVKREGHQLLVLAGGDHTRMIKQRDGAVLVRMTHPAPGEHYDAEEVAGVLDLDVAAIAGWQPTKHVLVVAEKPALFDVRLATREGYEDMRFADYHTPKLPPGTYAIDVIAKHVTPDASYELIRLRKPGKLPADPVAAAAASVRAALPATTLTKEIRGAAKKLVFCGTLGGPPVMMPIEAAKQWGGSDTGDYDLACGVAPGVFETDGGHTGIAFYQDAAELHLTSDGALVMYRNYGERELGLAAALVATGWHAARERFVSTGKLVLFDPVNEGPKKSNVTLAAGAYRVEHLPKFKCVVDGEEVCVSLVRLVSASARGGRSPRPRRARAASGSRRRAAAA